MTARIVLSGPGGGARDLQPEGNIVVGSGSDADWRISTADLAPRHFVVSTHGGTTRITPVTPDNVVVVNGAQIRADAAAIADGDVILAGSGRFALTSDSAPSVPAPLNAATLPLAYLVDDEARVAHPLTNRSTAIGRDASNTIVVRDPTASRFHAEIRREAGGFSVRSMGASGTMLNGAPLHAPAMLREGDLVEVAFLRLRFTERTPPDAISIGSPRPAENDEAARKATLGSVRAVGDTRGVTPANGSRGSGRRRWLVVIVLLLATALWWFVR